MKILKSVGFLLLFLTLVNFVTYFLFKHLTQNVALTIFVILSFITILYLLLLIITGLVLLIKLLFKKKITYTFKRLTFQATWLVGLTILMVLQVIFSQYTSYTPSTKVDGSYASLEKINLNGTTQWISVRTKNKSNPVLLFLAGGPGGTQLAATRSNLEELESYFTVVNWEQPGVGKSYDARHYKTLTADTYLQDAHELTRQLKDRYHQDKIYLIGESWGSYLGILLSKHYPEDYHAFIGTGQMVDFIETDQYCYDLALQIANDRNDINQIKAMGKIKRPPLYGDNISLDSATYLNYLYSYMQDNPDIHNTSFDTIDSILGSEYGIYDKINFLRGLYFTYSHVYQQLYGIDLRKTHLDFEIPIYIFHGRHDVNAPGYLAEDYFNKISAPKKEFVWFEHSGHNPWINETDLFIELTVEKLLNND